MSSIQDIYKIGNQMEKMHKKVSLLTKKKESFGLTAEEEKKLSEYRIQSWILHEELIETHFNISIMPYLISKESTEALKEIQKVIPWDGGFIRKEEDIEKIASKATELTEEELQFISKKLEFVHVAVLQKFELFCSSEEGYMYMQDASKVISAEEDGNVLDVLMYLDSRYRELADLLEIELQELEVMWEDEENDETEKDS